ncbi:hypothetical protein [Sulfobacillus harzensis]|uniref:Uncharacterized protein n=1 Tax=Sulfobacillus harzensis TaxID=2729629 RepID=A0A7Y0L8S4_9FIRM|nr:hypothetical protein [Sulfobacillus harzensis]NMP23994.1 hypothetical protein [Sulfobacillus harzensis]
MFYAVWAVVVAGTVWGGYRWRMKQRPPLASPAPTPTPASPEGVTPTPPVTGPGPTVVVQAAPPAPAPRISGGRAVGRTVRSILEVVATVGDVVATVLRLALIAAIVAGVIWLAGTPLIADRLGTSTVVHWLVTAHAALSRWAEMK